LKDELGQNHVLDSTSATFNEDITAIIKSLKPNVIYEYLGGDVTGKIFEKMVPESEMLIIGNLSHTPLVLNSGDIIFGAKVTRGFILYRWWVKLTEEEKKSWTSVVTEDFKADGAQIFGTHILKEVTLGEWREAMEEAPKVATQGKIIFALE